MSPAEVLIDAWRRGKPLSIKHGKITGPKALEGIVEYYRAVLWDVLATPIGAQVLALSAEQRERYQERAAIIEHDGRIDSHIASLAAMLYLRYQS